MVILYLGPNTIMPLASIVAAISGVVLIFWQYICRAVGSVLGLVVRKRPGAETPEDKADGQGGS